MKQTLIELQEANPQLMVEILIDRTSRQKIRKSIEHLRNVTKQINLIYAYIDLHTTTAKHTFISNA